MAIVKTPTGNASKHLNYILSIKEKDKMVSKRDGYNLELPYLDILLSSLLMDYQRDTTILEFSRVMLIALAQRYSNEEIKQLFRIGTTPFLRDNKHIDFREFDTEKREIKRYASLMKSLIEEPNVYTEIVGEKKLFAKEQDLKNFKQEFLSESDETLYQPQSQQKDTSDVKKNAEVEEEEEKEEPKSGSEEKEKNLCDACKRALLSGEGEQEEEEKEEKEEPKSGSEEKEENQEEVPLNKEKIKFLKKEHIKRLHEEIEEIKKSSLHDSFIKKILISSIKEKIKALNAEGEEEYHQTLSNLVPSNPKESVYFIMKTIGEEFPFVKQEKLGEVMNEINHFIDNNIEILINEQEAYFTRGTDEEAS